MTIPANSQANRGSKDLAQKRGGRTFRGGRACTWEARLNGFENYVSEVRIESARTLASSDG